MAKSRQRLQPLPILLAGLMIPVLEGRSALPEATLVPRGPMPGHVCRFFEQAIRTAKSAQADDRPEAFQEARALDLASLTALSETPWPDLSGLPRIRFQTRSAPTRPSNQWTGAWLVTNRGTHVILLESDFTERRHFTNEFQAFQPASYRDELRDLIRHLEESAARTNLQWRFERSWDGMGYLDHAYAAAWLGLTNEATALLHALWRQRGSVSPFAELARAAATASYLEGLEMLERGEARSRVAAHWQNHLRLFSTNRYPQLAEYVVLLQQQAAEFAKLAATAVEAPSSLPPEERAGYYLDRLPDAQRRADTGPLFLVQERLIALGRGAVPGLIEHLDDRRLTRFTNRRSARNPWSRAGSEAVLLRAQDLALECVEQIAGIRFFAASEEAPLFSTMKKTPRDALIAEVRAWWDHCRDKPFIAGRVFRLGRLPIHQRIAELQQIEMLDPQAVDAVAELRRWATNAQPHELRFLAGASFKRGDFSLLPVLRERWRQGHFDDITLLLQFGDAADYGRLRDAEHRRSRAGEELAALDYSRFAFRLAKLLELGEPTPRAISNLNVVPLLVDTLEYRRLWDEFHIDGQKARYSAADLAMDALIRVTGHNEGYRAGDAMARRYAAIDRWIGWWTQTGCTAFLARHPETKAAFGDVELLSSSELDPAKLPWLVRIATADPMAPIGYEVPRFQAVAFVKSGQVMAKGTGEAQRFRFTSRAAESNWWAEAKPLGKTNPLPAMHVGAEDGPWADALGRIWCTFNSPARVIARIDGTTWTAFPQPQGAPDFGDRYARALPLLHGAMLFLPTGNSSIEPCSFLDDQGRIAANGVGQLLANSPERVGRAIPGPPNAVIGSLTKDAAGNIWWAAGGQIGVVSGRQHTVAHAPEIGLNSLVSTPLLAPLGHGARIWAYDQTGAVVLEPGAGRIGKVMDAPQPPARVADRFSRNLRDRQGRTWLGGARGSFAMGEDGTVVATNAGNLLLEDHQGGLWFRESGRAYDTASIVRLAPGRTESRISLPRLLSPLCEAPDGSVWVLTRNGLTRLTLSTRGIEVADEFRIAADREVSIACDHAGRIWLNHRDGFGRRELRCYAVLPAAGSPPPSPQSDPP